MRYLLWGGIILLVGAGLYIAINNGGAPSSQLVEPFYPEPTDFVVDVADALTDDDQHFISVMAKDIEERTGKEVVVAVVKSTRPLTIEQYGIKLAEKWKVGKAGEDNGIIVILAVEDRKARIEVGKGLEGKINDAKAGRILDEHIVPQFKNNDWAKGLIAGVGAIKTELEK